MTTNLVVDGFLAPVRVALLAIYGLLFGVVYALVTALCWFGKGSVQLIRGYAYYAYCWQPRGRTPRYEVSPVFDAGVTAALLLSAGIFTYLRFAIA